MEKHLLKASILVREGSGSHQRGSKDKSRQTQVFTGKLVKSLIIDGEPSIRRFFEKTSGSSPKIIHVTPLYIESGKVICVHSLDRVNSGGKYSFYVGFIESDALESPSFDGIYGTLLNISGRHRFRGRVLDVELVSLETLDVGNHARNIVSNLRKTGKLRVIFASPTLLRDPFRAGKHKSLIPTPMNIFSTPVYVNLYLTGKLRQKSFARSLVLLHRLLNEPYSVHRTAKLTWVRYDDYKSPIPALIGYVNLFLNRDYYERYLARGVDVDALLKDTLSTALAVGVGTSRATGFGHIIISVPSGS